MKNSSNYSIAKKIFPYLPARFRNILYYRYLLSGEFPEIVHIENTNACNAKCIMCPRDKMTRNIGFMDFSLFQKIIDECAVYRELKEVHLHGFGECLLEKDFCRKVLYAKENGIRTIYIVTNSSLLTENISKDLISSGLDKIKISFYGATDKTYENVHVNLKFNEVEHNILTLFRNRDAMKRKNPSILLQFLPLKENIYEKNLFFEKWEKVIDKSRGDSIVEYRLHNYGVGRKYNIVETDISSKKSCSLPFTTMQILWNGDVVPCCFDFNGDFILANIKKRTLKEVWNNYSFTSLRNAHRALDFETLHLCNKCDQNVKNNR